MDSDHFHPGPNEPAAEGAGPGDRGGTQPGDDPRGRLEQRLDRASEAAERLISEAAASAVRRPPPAGWQRSESEPDAEPGSGNRADRTTSEIELLIQAVYAVRDRIPPELQHRLGLALREVLLALRALIDWYLERGHLPSEARSEVQDIPIL